MTKNILMKTTGSLIQNVNHTLENLNILNQFLCGAWHNELMGLYRPQGQNLFLQGQAVLAVGRVRKIRDPVNQVHRTQSSTWNQLRNGIGMPGLNQS